MWPELDHIKHQSTDRFIFGSKGPILRVRIDYEPNRGNRTLQSVRMLAPNNKSTTQKQREMWNPGFLYAYACMHIYIYKHIFEGMGMYVVSNLSGFHYALPGSSRQSPHRHYPLFGAYHVFQLFLPNTPTDAPGCPRGGGVQA